MEALEVDLDLIDFLLEVMVTLVESYLLLLHDHLLVLEVYHTFMDLLQFVVLMHQDCLFLDPLTVKLIAFLLEFLTLPQ